VVLSCSTLFFGVILIFICRFLALLHFGMFSNCVFSLLLLLFSPVIFFVPVSFVNSCCMGRSFSLLHAFKCNFYFVLLRVPVVSIGTRLFVLVVLLLSKVSYLLYRLVTLRLSRSCHSPCSILFVLDFFYVFFSFCGRFFSVCP